MTDNLYNGSRLTAHGSRLTAHEVDSVQFSIIVPVYNCEKYLNKCLDSLCNQDIYTLTNSRNYEIIIVDDGSTDKSGEICDSYAEKFSFIRVTHSEHKGYTPALNIGLRNCQGRYIMFCDSDDYVSPQLISIITRAVELDDKVDMFVYKFMKDNLYSEWPVYDINDMKVSDWKMTNGEKLCHLILNEDHIGGYTWNKVCKREFIQDIYFDESLSIVSDQVHTFEVLCRHKNMCIACIDYYIYYYVQHSDQGMMRLVNNMYDKDGKNRWLSSLESEVSIEGMPTRVIEQIKGNIYMLSLTNLRRHPLGLSEEARAHLMSNIKKYFAVFYRSPNHSLVAKLKSFVKHVLIILRINK